MCLHITQELKNECIAKFRRATCSRNGKSLEQVRKLKTSKQARIRREKVFFDHAAKNPQLPHLAYLYKADVYK